jgi:hypothetical protein
MRAIVVSEVAMPADTKMVTTLMELDLLARVDDFRFEQRFKSRAAAMKFLMDAALKAGLKPTAEDHERWS